MKTIKILSHRRYLMHVDVVVVIVVAFGVVRVLDLVNRRVGNVDFYASNVNIVNDERI